MGEEIAITFETLYDILRREKQREELLELEKTFFRDIVIYLQEKIRVWENIRKDTDLFSMGERDKVEGEIKNTKKLLKDIYEKREKKIIDLAINKSRIGHNIEASNLLEEERKFFEDLVKVLDNYRHGILLNLLHIKIPDVKPTEAMPERKQDINGKNAAGRDEKSGRQETITVKFVHAVPKFIGSDLAIYGPFDENDLAILPKDSAEILISKKRAEEIRKE